MLNFHMNPGETFPSLDACEVVRVINKDGGAVIGLVFAAPGESIFQAVEAFANGRYISAYIHGEYKRTFYNYCREEWERRQ